MNIRSHQRRAREQSAISQVESMIRRLPSHIPKPPAVTGPPLYEVVHGQLVDTEGHYGMIGLDTLPTGCDAAFETYDIEEVVTERTILPDGFGVVRNLNADLQWACNYNGLMTRDLIETDILLAFRSIRLPISGTSPTQYITFLAPWAFAER